MINDDGAPYVVSINIESEEHSHALTEIVLTLRSHDIPATHEGASSLAAEVIVERKYMPYLRKECSNYAFSMSVDENADYVAHFHFTEKVEAAKFRMLFG